MTKIIRHIPLLLLFCLTIGTGCFRHYYQSIAVTGSSTTNKQKSNLLMLMYRMNKYVVVHYNERTWHIKQLEFDSTANKTTGYIEPVTEPYEKIMKTRGESNWDRYKEVDREPTRGLAHVLLN